MNKSIEESIHNFEHKKEFREVKLKTRESFREDQVALERRLSKRVNLKKDSAMLHMEIKSKDDTDLPESAEINGSLSKLESIVLDIEQDKATDRVRNNSIGGSSSNNSLDNNVLDGESPERTRISSGKYVHESNLTANGNVITTNGKLLQGQDNRSFQEDFVSGKSGVVREVISPKSTGTTLQQALNGQVNGTSTLINRPKVTAQARVAMTPEPRLKAIRGIYQKNPKLTASSTEHLDNLSLKGFRATGLPQGPRIDSRQGLVSLIPAAEITSIPSDGNLCAFSKEQMVTIFRLLNLPEELICRLYKYKVDGKRFAILTDAELEDMGINNPVVRYFRDRSAQRPRKKVPEFML